MPVTSGAPFRKPRSRRWRNRPNRQLAHRRSGAVTDGVTRGRNSGRNAPGGQPLQTVWKLVALRPERDLSGRFSVLGFEPVRTLQRVDLRTPWAVRTPTA